MQLVNKLSTMILISLFLSLFIGCDKDDNDPTSPVQSSPVGNWELTKVIKGSTELTPQQAQMQVSVSFKEDKTFSISGTQVLNMFDTTGTWSISGGMMRLENMSKTSWESFTCSVIENKMDWMILLSDSASQTIYLSTLQFTKQ